MTKFTFLKNKQFLALIATAFLLACGVIFYAIGWEFVLKLTPIIITIIAALQLIFWDQKPKIKLIAALSIFIFGTIIEYIGIHTGFLFGEYSYSATLGFKAFGLPFVVGILWFVVSLSAWQIACVGQEKLYK